MFNTLTQIAVTAILPAFPERNAGCVSVRDIRVQQIADKKNAELKSSAFFRNFVQVNSNRAATRFENRWSQAATRLRGRNQIIGAQMKRPNQTESLWSLSVHCASGKRLGCGKYSRATALSTRL